MLRSFIKILLLSMLAGCGRQTVTPVPAPEPVPPIDPTIPISKVELKLFSAQWCQPCKNLAVKLIKEVGELPATTRSKFTIQVYVISGPRQGSTPTQADADYYKKTYLPIADKALPDVRSAEYRRVKAGDGSIPAAVVLKNDNVAARPRSNELDIVEAILESL